MNRTAKQLIGLAAASVLLAGVANGMFTQGGYGPGWGGHHGMMGNLAPGFYPGHMFASYSPEATAERLSVLKERIGITKAQSPAWDEYSAAVEDKVNLMQSHRNAFFGTDSDINQFQSRHQQGLNSMQQLFNATRNLYATLTPEQRARAGDLIGLHHGPR